MVQNLPFVTQKNYKKGQDNSENTQNAISAPVCNFSTALIMHLLNHLPGLAWSYLATGAGIVHLDSLLSKYQK